MQKYWNFPKRHRCFLTKHILVDMNQLRMSQGRTGKSSASWGGSEKIVWNRYLYQVPYMVGTNAYTNENHKFYSSKVQGISILGGYCATEVGAICACFVGVGDLVKNHVENILIKLFYFRGQTIDTYDQAVFTLKDSGIHGDEVKKISLSNPLTAVQRSSGRFVSFMMTVHSYQADPNWNHSCITCRACVKLPLYGNGIYASINTQMLKTPHDLLFRLADLYNGINPEIGTIKKEKGCIFSEWCTEIFKEKNYCDV